MPILSYVERWVAKLWGLTGLARWAAARTARCKLGRVYFTLGGNPPVDSSGGVVQSGLLVNNRPYTDLKIDKEMQLKRGIAPGTKLESEIMESTTDRHNGVTKALFPIANFIFGDAHALHPADDVLDAHA